MFKRTENKNVPDDITSWCRPNTQTERYYCKFILKKKKIINASEETHRPAKTLVQMGLSKGFLAVDSRQQEKKNREDMLKGRGKREIVRERRCQ